VKAALLIAIWLVASPVYAAEPIELCAPNVKVRRVVMHHNGRPGVWFDADVARCMLTELRKTEQLQLQVADYAQRTDLSFQYTDLVERQRDLAVMESEKALGALESAVRGRREAEEALNKPGRSRALWFAVGLVTGVLVIGVSAYALSATR
jgi:cytochrome c-type biogenesis protein CcmH/NrfG